MRLLALTAAAALACAAPDASRAEGATPILEIVTFRLVEGVDSVAFLDAARRTEALLRDRGTVVRRALTLDDDGLWTDVVQWTSMDASLSAAEAVMAEPEFVPFASMIDETSIQMRHARILWQME